jgi:hypothetical protein
MVEILYFKKLIIYLFNFCISQKTYKQLTWTTIMHNALKFNITGMCTV